MNTLKELQHKFVCDLRAKLHDYEFTLFEQRLVRLDCPHRKPLLTHLIQLRELTEQIEDIMETTLREFRDRSTSPGYILC